MRAFLAAAIVLTCAAGAHANLYDGLAVITALASAYIVVTIRQLHAIAVGASGAMVESDYFQAPKPQYSSRGMSVCRLHTEIFSKMRLAQACR